jgi:glycosyltransferase involved in cell wall biosynthesis
MQPIRPVKKMGYLGAFDDRIDLDLLADVALAFPEYLIEVIGPKKITPGQSLPNHVVFLGPKPQNELLTYLSQWSVCLIPFAKTSFTRTIYPLKINEYLAAGKPVVTTDFADLSDFEGIIRIGTDSASFIQGIQRELRGDNRLKASKRRDFAVENSWEVRTTQFLKALAS